MDNPEVESDFLRSVHALLRELDGHHPAFQSERGMLRWTLHKKIDRNPSNGALLIKILVKELERAERCNYRQYIIPLLHTLMYTLIKAPCIPDDLYERVYDFCKKLLTLPKPYCTIGLDYARQLKLERTIPGALYQRMVSAEQSLKNDSFPYQEKVFMFVDPELLSEAVCRALIDEIKAAQMSQCMKSCMLCVIERAFQTVLKEHGHVKNVHSILQAKPLDVTEHYFQQVMAAIEHAGRDMSAEYNQYVEELGKIYSTLLSTSEKDVEKTAVEKSSGIPLPNPNISFHLWRDEDQLWKELVLFLRSPSQSCEQDSLSPELDIFEFQDMGPDFDCCEQTRFSVLSNDSGIERDLPILGDENQSCTAEAEHSRLQRKGCMKKKGSPLDSLAFLQSGSNGQGAKPAGKLHRKSGGSVMEPVAQLKRLHTARVLVLGDDRILGRLAQAYYSLRKRESRRAFLTPRLKVQFYYVPVVEEQPTSSPTEEGALPDQTEPCELAAYLGRADPWYESNINTLCHMIPKLATMPSSPSKSTVSELFIVDVIAYYVRLGLQPVFFQVYAVKLFFSNADLEPVEDIFLIELSLMLEEFNPSRDTLPTKKKLAVEVPGADLTLMYKKVLLSNREKEETLSLRSTGLVIKAIPSNETEDLVCLNVNTTEVVKVSNLSGRSYSLVTNTIRTRNIKIRSTEQRTFTVCLDKDSRRLYKNVTSIEVFPCLEPSYCLQKTRTRRSSLEEEEDVGLAKYLPKSLLLPINTFAGIVQ
ncbi:phosphoinositide 3-kinase regulatory subunit 6 isoform X1 [Podarcis raffonei]|uniref:phosphoinositide 3-kinase regulatory subunit 6 isoform X1 n=1 Tax=Podarcis raffonei TaxID=65483 RepID=UPI002329822F|nr:phosphoinositide 3-kinase regulatory subunit 6 isoform X1 [Podarcis raffonei]